ncbi:HlyD family secretion protein [Lysobacter sp. A289]
MSHELFRREVLDAKRTSWLGGISLAQPVRLWILTTVAVVVALTIALFLTFGTYTRRSRVVGQLVPIQGMATVLAPATGVLTRVDVPEGGKVSAGQTLAVVTVPRATLLSGDTTAALAQRLQRRQDGMTSAQSAQQQLLEAQSSGLATQLTIARRELAQIETGIATRQKQVDIANQTMARLRQLQQGQYVSELQVTQQQAATLEQVGEVQILQRQAIGTRRLIAQLQQALQEVPGQRQTSEANFQRDLAVLEQEQVETQARGALVLRAPVSGIVATQLAKPGQAVQAGQPLLSLLPGDGTLEAELLVPSRSIGFIEPGDSVLMRYQAYPYQKFGHHQGQVTHISRSAITTADSSAIESFYRVNVALNRQTVTAYGQLEPLKPGMLLDADVLGEKRTLIEWVLEPIYSIQGTVFAL